MAGEAPFIARTKSLAAQRFLYACAFWAVASDEKLDTAEQQWLVRQFGQQGTTKSLEEFVGLESAQFFTAFDNAAAALSDQDKVDIYPKLEAWLIACVSSDGEKKPSETETIAKMKWRLSLDREIARLTKAKDPALRSTGKLRVHAEQYQPAAMPVPQPPPVKKPSAISTTQPSARKPSAISEPQPSAEKPSAIQETIPATPVPQPARTVALIQNAPKTERMLVGHMGDVLAVAINRHCTSIITGSADCSVKIWSIDTGSEKFTLKVGDSPVSAVAFACESTPPLTGNQSCVVGDSSGAVTAWRTGNAEAPMWKDETRQGAITAIVVQHDEKRMLACAKSGCCILYATKTGERIAETVTPRKSSVNCAAFPIEESGVFVSGAADGVLRLWNIHSAEQIREFKADGAPVSSVSFAPSGKFILAGYADGFIRIWEVDSGQNPFALKAHDGSVTGVAVDMTGRFIISASDDSSIRVVDVNQKREILRSMSQGCRFRDIAFNSAANTAISAGTGNVFSWCVSVDLTQAMRSPPCARTA